MGQNIFVAAYREFQLGTGSKPNVPVGDVKNPDARYEYQYGGTGASVDGTFKGTDCSNLVWRALKDAGYAVPDIGADHSGFTTHNLFNGSVPTDYAKANFDLFSATEATNKNGSLQVGDIIMFKSNTGDGQHVGIFFGYDSAGNPMFYGSQTSTGPAIANMTPESKGSASHFILNNHATSPTH